MLQTERLDIPAFDDVHRDPMIAMFTDPRFMVFSGGVLDQAAAEAHADRMRRISDEVSFGKRPLVIRATGEVVGYAGVGQFEFDGVEWFEFGWRLIESARGSGYATEAATAVLAHAGDVWSGDIIAMIDPRNGPSMNVARKVGFRFWQQTIVEGYLDNIYRITVG